MSIPKRLAALLAASAALVAIVALPQTAYADTVTVTYSCEIPLTGTQTGDVDVTILNCA